MDSAFRADLFFNTDSTYLSFGYKLFGSPNPENFRQLMKTRKTTFPTASIPLVVRIGIIGGVSCQAAPFDIIQTKIKDALLLIITTVQKLSATHPDIYSEEIELRLLSTLTEEIQLLAAQEASDFISREASDLKFSLQLSLPCDIERCKDNLSAASQSLVEKLAAKAVVFELNAPEISADAVITAGKVVLRQCDILITICSSDPSKSEKVLTEDAFATGIPIIWISPEENHEICLWEREPKAKTATHHEGLLEDLSRRLKSTLLIGPGSSGHLHRYREEPQPTWTFGFIFKSFCRLWVRKWSKSAIQVPEFQKSAENEWEKIWAPLKNIDPDLLQYLKDRFFSEFARADGLAEYLVNLYRSSFVATYLMGATAILFAFLGSREGASKYYLVAELILISIIIALTMKGRQSGWHERWIDYRVLAEELRQMQFLILFGRITSSFRVPAHLQERDPRSTWFNWQFRATVRQAGILGVKLDKLHLDAYRRVLLNWVRSQKRYHTLNYTKYKKLHGRLRSTTQGFFIATLIACFLHLLPSIVYPLKIWLLEHHTVHEQYDFWLSLSAIVLPALGGAFGAIIHIGELERTVLRSKNLRQKMKEIASQLIALGEGASASDLGRQAQDFSEIALDELVDWRFAFIDKELSLPA